MGAHNLHPNDWLDDAAPAAPDPSAAPVRVALVNHHVLLRDVLRPLLDSHDHITVVVETEGAHVDIDALVGANPDVVLVQVAGTHDGELIQDLARHLLKAHLIVLSGADTNEVVATAFDSGAHGYLSLALPVNAVIDAISKRSGHGTHQDRAVHAVPEARTSGEIDRSRFLTARETDVLRRIANGESTIDIAAALGVATTTVRTHTANILSKLGLHSKVAAAAYAARHGLL